MPYTAMVFNCLLQIGTINYLNSQQLICRSMNHTFQVTIHCTVPFNLTFSIIDI